MADVELELLEVQRPARQLATKRRLAKKPQERAVVRDQRESHAFEVVAPLAHAVNDAEGFQLVNGVLLLCGGKCFLNENSLVFRGPGRLTVPEPLPLQKETHRVV